MELSPATPNVSPQCFLIGDSEDEDLLAEVLPPIGIAAASPSPSWIAAAFEDATSSLPFVAAAQSSDANLVSDEYAVGTRIKIQSKIPWVNGQSAIIVKEVTDGACKCRYFCVRFDDGREDEVSIKRVQLDTT